MSLYFPLIRKKMFTIVLGQELYVRCSIVVNKQIHHSRYNNLVSIEIRILQAIDIKDKSDVPQYLHYQDHGFRYFPHKTFIPYIQKLDTNLRKLINVQSLNKHRDTYF